MARRATRLSPKALLRLRQKLIDEGLYQEDRPEDTKVDGLEDTQ